MKTHVGLFHSARLTEYTQQLSAGKNVEPIPTRYGVDDAPGKSRARGMIFVSPRALLHFINFNGVLGEYCILMMKVDSWITQGYINGLNSQRELDAATIMSQRSTIARQSTDAADTLSLLARIEAGMRQNRDEFTVQLKSVRSDLGEKIQEANERVVEVLEVLEEANKKLDEAAVERARMLSTIGNIAEMLVEKSLTSTMNPEDPDLVHHYAIIARPIQINKSQGHRLELICAQNKNVDRSIKAKLADPDHEWSVLTDKKYNASPIDLRNNSKVRVCARLDQLEADENARRVMDVNAKNRNLKEEIAEHNRDVRAWNKAHKTESKRPLRKFSTEKIPSPEKFKWSGIGMKWNARNATFVENDLITLDQLLDIVHKTNTDTQRSPYNSEDEADAP
ncbi:hypothetical protein JG687_00019411 [Phytophthora cactorum]|uniref:Uncharacterized protein n=2 Tax=Phytophthora cactorum TaxID=29920 RepID=A0A8T1TJ49_9STRA|nr:hypothetical protein JG687_00019411 [Phytophthora cactorum]